MAVVDLACTLAAPADAVWGAVQTPAAFRLVTRNVISMPVLRHRVEPWHAGETVEGWVLLFGVLPFSRHRLHVHEIDQGERRLSSREHGGVVRRWDHDITVEAIDAGSCRYRDRIEIDAGPFTPLVVTWARLFYRIRQRRWRELANVLRAVDG